MGGGRGWDVITAAAASCRDLESWVARVTQQATKPRCHSTASLNYFLHSITASVTLSTLPMALKQQTQAAAPTHTVANTHDDVTRHPSGPISSQHGKRIFDVTIHFVSGNSKETRVGMVVAS